MSPGIECIGSLLTGCILFASIILILCAAWALLPKVRAGCGKPARPDPRRGSWATVIPTPTLPSLWSLSNQSLLGSRSRHSYAITHSRVIQEFATNNFVMRPNLLDRSLPLIASKAILAFQSALNCLRFRFICLSQRQPILHLRGLSNFGEHFKCGPIARNPVNDFNSEKGCLPHLVSLSELEIPYSMLVLSMV